MTSQLYGYKTVVHNFMCMCRQWTQAILSQLWGLWSERTKLVLFMLLLYLCLCPLP